MPGPLQKRIVPLAFGVVLLLAATSGLVDAASYLRFHVFAANQTGNLVIVAVSFTDPSVAEARVPSLIGLVAFTIGVFVAVGIRSLLAQRGAGARVCRETLLGIEVALLASTAVLFITQKNLSLMSIAILSISQAFQGVVLTRVAGIGVSTVVINTALVSAADQVAQRHRRAALVLIATPIGYFIGALCGAALPREPLPLPLIAAVLCSLVAALLMRVVDRRGGDIG